MTLIDRLSNLDGPDRVLDAEICILLQYGGENSEGAMNARTDPEWDDNDLIFEIDGEGCCKRIPNLTASVDAAIALAERVLPGWVGIIPLTNEGEAWIWKGGSMNKGHRVTAATPAIALCIAILRAKEASKT